MDKKQGFIGRRQELKLLNSLLEKKTASLVVLRGRRRVGKSRLLSEFGLQMRTLDFTGLAPKKGVTAQDQRDAFARKLYEHFGLIDIAKDDWSSLFSWLAKNTAKGRYLIIFDEISWMAEGDATFLPKLKNYWDESFKKNCKVILALCGSVSIWIERNILSSTAFLGRVSLEMVLEQLSLQESVALLNLMGFKGSTYEILQVLSVTGGIPWYLEQVLPSDNAFSFINRLCFTKNGILTKDFEKIFHDLFNKRSDVYRRVVEELANGARDYNQLCEHLQYRKSGRLSEYLDNLIESGFVTRDYTWQIASGEIGRLSQFRLSDNYCRFYLKFIIKQLKKIDSGRLKVTSMSSFPGYESMMGLQFENLLLHNRDALLEKINIPLADVIVDNPYFQRKTTTQEGCQVDYLVQTKYKTLYVFEFKFSREPLGKSVIAEVESKCQRLSLSRNMTCIPVLVHANGVSDPLLEADYFARVIDVNELLTS